MDRFSQLEFGESNPQKQPNGETVRNAKYYYDSAVKYWLNGDFEVALRNYSRTLEKNNSIFEAWAGQVQMLIELEEYFEAKVWADKALEFFPENPELLSLKAVACARDGQMEKAVAYSDDSVTKDNLTARVWLARAEIMQEHKGAVADTCLSKAVKLDSDSNPIVKLEAARLLRRWGQYGNAIQYLNYVLQKFPDSALAWYELGCCQMKLGRPEARETLEQCVNLQPQWEIAKQMLRKCGRGGFFRRLFGR